MSTLGRKMAAHATGTAIIAVLSALLALAFMVLTQTPVMVK